MPEMKNANEGNNRSKNKHNSSGSFKGGRRLSVIVLVDIEKIDENKKEYNCENAHAEQKCFVSNKNTLIKRKEYFKNSPKTEKSDKDFSYESIYSFKIRRFHKCRISQLSFLMYFCKRKYCIMFLIMQYSFQLCFLTFKPKPRYIHTR